MLHEIAQPAKTPFETLLTVRPFQVVEFLDGASAIRNVLTARSHTTSTLITPLRGALPLLWATEGFEGIEPPLPVHVHEIALGLFKYTSHTGETRTTSPSYEQKAGLLEDLFSGLSNEQVKRLLLLDEVQKGGTISTAAHIIQKILQKNYPSHRLGIIAAQDSRLPVMRQPKTQTYELIASNSLDDIRTNVIPMPLIATDRDALLDGVFLSGSRHDSHLASHRFTVVRNKRAEILFRMLGSIARDPNVRHDDSFISKFIDTQGGLSESVAARTEFWLPKLLSYLDGNADKP